MDYEIESRFQKLVEHLEKDFGGGLDAQSILFLIGVQEYGKGFGKFSKDQKLDLMHIGVCTILMPYGYYEFVGRDEEGWPHFETKSKLPNLNDRQQQHLIKESMLDYFGF